MHPQVASLQQHHIHLPITVRTQMRGSPNYMHHQKVHRYSSITSIFPLLLEIRCAAARITCIPRLHRYSSITSIFPLLFEIRCAAALIACIIRRCIAQALPQALWQTSVPFLFQCRTAVALVTCIIRGCIAKALPQRHYDIRPISVPLQNRGSPEGWSPSPCSPQRTTAAAAAAAQQENRCRTRACWGAWRRWCYRRRRCYCCCCCCRHCCRQPYG
jgi:hypothetical protein